MNKTLIILLCALLSGVMCLGQSSLNCLKPGKSTRAQVERILGQPVRELSETLAEYKTGKETEKIFVQYQQDSSVVERIETAYSGTIKRATVINSLKLPARATAAQINEGGRLEEYFAAANVVLTYAAGNAASGVSGVGYYSRELFESAMEYVPRSSQNQDRRAAADSSAPERPRLSTSASSSGRSSTSAARPSSELEQTTTETPPSAKSSSGVTIMRTPVEFKDGAIVLTPPDLSDSGKEIFVSRERLEKLVGRYEFDRPDALPLQEVRVDWVDGKLRWNAGSAKYTLIPTGTEQESDAAGQAERDTLQFKLSGKPGAKVQFNLIHGEPVMLLYFEERAGKMITVVGTPKS